jgi:hypothetical protein
MSSLNSIAFKIWNQIRPIISDDDAIDIRDIKEDIHRLRALYIRNELNKGNRVIDDTITQDLQCVELELSDTADCCNVTSDCSVLRTVLEIPNPVELHNGNGLLRVGPIDKLEKSFPIISYDTVPYVGNSRFNKSAVFAFLLNSRVYLVSKSTEAKMIKRINIRGIFENPGKLKDFQNCSGISCYTDDDEYPISNHILTYVEEGIINKYIKQFQLPIDKNNDGKHGLEPQQ